MPALIDRTGERYGRLLVTGRGQNVGRTKQAAWDCRCDCGTVVTVLGDNLRTGNSRSCGCLHREITAATHLGELTPGDRFGRLVVLRRDRNLGRQAAWLCECDCGYVAIVRGTCLRLGRVRSCGCLLREHPGMKPRHGMTGTPTWNSWSSMLARCTDPNATGWKHYGGRGIRVCPQWQRGPGGFERFLADMGTRPVGTSLDRIDNEGNYEPSNCRWATPKEQRSNQRPR